VAPGGSSSSRVLQYAALDLEPHAGACGSVPQLLSGFSVGAHCGSNAARRGHISADDQSVMQPVLHGHAARQSHAKCAPTNI
jgi:hypothetical protein